MCITSWWYPKDHPTIKFVMVFNRDEVLERSTTAAHWWKLETDTDAVLSSTDDRTSKASALTSDSNSNIEEIKQYEYSSTWLGISKEGRISCLNNLWLKPAASPVSSTFEKTLSRGYLVTNFLTGQETSEQYLKSILKDADDYSGFALLVGNIKDKAFSYLQNSIGDGYNKIEPINIQDDEFHILSNLGYPSNTTRAKTLLPEFKNIAKSNTEWDTIIEKLLQLLGPQKNSLLKADNQLDDVFVTKHDRRGYSYGTETTTIILVNHSNELKFVERNWYKKDTDDYTKTFEWTI